jgi:hypothetical protein
VPHFVVLLHGKGISVPAIDGSGDPMLGFLTSRAVTAKDAQAASQAAITLVAREWARGPHASANRGVSPVVIAEEVTEIGWLKRLLSRRRGYAFYSDAEDEDHDSSSAA